MNFDLIIFDCDGTLVDSEYLNNLATIQILHEVGLTQYDMKYAFAHFVGRRMKNILSDLEKETGHVFAPDMAQRYINRVQELGPQYLKEMPGARDIVETALNKNKKICVASNGQRDNVIQGLELASLRKYFADEHIFTAVEVPNGKPAPDLFLHTLKKMNAVPERSIVIEDSVAGVTGAVAAGLKTYGFVSHPDDAEAYAERLLEAGAASVFMSLIHIKQALFS